MSASAPIGVYIVDDHPIVRAGLRSIEDVAPQIRIVGEAANIADAWNGIIQHQPDVVLLDIRVRVKSQVLLKSGPVQSLLKGFINRRPEGPSEDERVKAFSVLWGEVRNASGSVRTSRMRTPEGYTLTALTSLLIVDKVLQGQAPAGVPVDDRRPGPDRAARRALGRRKIAVAAALLGVQRRRHAPWLGPEV